MKGLGWVFVAYCCAAVSPVAAQSIEGSAELNSGYVSDEQFRFGRYSGLVDEGEVFWLDFSLRSAGEADDADYWWLQGRDMGLDTVSLRGEMGTRGERSFSLAYRELPHYFFDAAQTPFVSAGDEALTLPGSWQAGGDTTGTFTNLNNTLHPFRLRNDRRRLDLGYENQLSADWDVFANYRREVKEGWRSLAGAIGIHGGNSRAALLPAGIDFETDTVELGVRYGDSRGALLFDYYASLFRNNDDALRWQNPFAANADWAAGVGYPDGRGQLALEPDNRFQRVRLSGNYRFGHYTRTSLELAYGQMQHDEDFLPYTINSGLSVTTPLPRPSLEGEVDTLNADWRLSTRAVDKVHLVLHYHLNERDNQTPRELYLPVVGDAQDQVIAADGFLNRPYSYRKQRAALDINYRMLPRVRFKTGYKLEMVERDYSEINESREYTLTLGTTINSLESLSLSFDYEYSERNAREDYVGNRPLIMSRVPGTVAPDEFENHPLLRKYYLADRQRDRLQLRVDWFINQRWSLGLSSAYNRDDYGTLNFGLNKSTLTSYTIDAVYQPSDYWFVSGFYTADYYEQQQSGRSFTFLPAQITDPNRNWNVTSDDRFTVASLSLESENLQRHWDWLRGWTGNGVIDGGVEVTDSHSTGEWDTSVASALTTAPLAPEETRIRTLRLYGSYEASDFGRLSVSWSQERFDSESFAIDGIAPNTMPNVLSVGLQSPEYTVNWVRIGYAREF